MDECCPLCRKLGNYKKVREVQVNYDEAVWLCEDEQCPWPFGYENFKFTPRRISELSTNPRSKSETSPISATSISPELGVYTPPMTPSNDVCSKDTVKTGNSAIRSPNNASFAGKISPTYRSRANPTPQLAEKIPQPSPIIPKPSTPVSSIFDIDSSVPIAKIKVLEVKEEPEATSDAKIFQKNKLKLKGRLKPVPFIRSIESIPHNSIKIEVKEDLATVPSPPKSVNTNTKCVTSTPITHKRSSLSEINESNHSDSTTDVPKKIVKTADDIVDMRIDELLDVSGNLTNNVGVNNAIDNSVPMGLSFIEYFDDMLMDDCQNVTHEIDDDWLKSLL